MRVNSSRLGLGVAVALAVMAAIFVADTSTDYAVAAAGFYTVVILAAARRLSARQLTILACACILLTLLSFALSGFGNYRVGLINSGIGIVTIMVTTYLALKMEAARADAQDAQARLLRVARASTLGELTTSIAHEVNQPLAAIVTSGNACQRWLAQSPPNLDKARQAVERILDDAQRASDVIVRVRGMTRGQAQQPQAFAINPAIEEVLSLARAELERHGVHVTLELSEELPPVFADRVQIQQVLANLVLNAVEAMSATPPGRRSLRVGSARAPDGRVRVSVADTGSGLPAAMDDQPFEAFWTTKADGLGLGLSISRGIIQASGGSIRAANRAQGGAELVFELPPAPGTSA
ncbi:sensor histidine kinase [Pseudoxanthomonas sp. 22568]|uniref:sensor histidine kinase n=1 Tax=Pseudoxanthomonas sp. 22568 TaxID=3453945 RepID=UPI003F83CDFD